MTSYITLAPEMYSVAQELSFADLVTLAGDGVLPYDAGNTERISAAAAALVTFAERTGLDADGEPVETAVTDLLADLMHLCNSGGMVFDGLLGTARLHHDAEMENEEEGR